jgi:large subunit ribosomal protein L25
MEKITFQKREIQGKKSKKLYEEGFIPAVVYNSKGESRNIQITSSEAVKITKEATSTTILDADLDGKILKVLVKEIDVNPLTEQIRHIAFFEIDESKEMVFTIPFEIVGVSPAVKNNLGILVDVLNSIDVRCKLSALVPFIEIDVTKLEHPGQSISVNEINIPEGMALVNDELATATIVTITELQEEVIIEPEVVEGEEGEGVEGEEGEEGTNEGAEGQGESEEKEE